MCTSIAVVIIMVCAIAVLSDYQRFDREYDAYERKLEAECRAYDAMCAARPPPLPPLD
jgi:hypothetical protein